MDLCKLEIFLKNVKLQPTGLFVYSTTLTTF